MPSLSSTLDRRTWLAGCAAATIALGCQVFDKPPDKALESLLKPVRTSTESVALEIFQARIPLDQEAKADALWERIDEQKFDAELRRKLVANGLRVGIVGGALPEDLAKLLELDGDAAEASDSQVITDQTAAPRVTRRVVQVKRLNPISIQVSELRDEAQVLLSQEGSFGGKTFRQMQGVYSLQAETVPGQRVKVRLTPELQHGDLKQRYAGAAQQGIFMSIPSREREVFDELSMDATLAPGELLVLGCLPAAKTSLGGVFHTATAAGKDERKLILVRLLQVPPSEILAEK
ncbi:MAG: hypothetical protein C0485_00870 [Pirellula sp.]|nr:hypothetical protein [Pirellula sp.]